MKITFYNFRCYRGEHEFEFLDDGITLICGESGRGKSTILNGFFFAIQGSGNGTKNITDGETTCKVTVSYSSFTISRSCRPNRVVLSRGDETFEDDDAQHRIFELFGKRFEYLSYIQQQSQKSFLFLSPAERLEVFEDILFDSRRAEQTPAEMKKKCTMEIRRLVSEKDKMSGALELIVRQIKQTKIQEKDVEFVDETFDTIAIERRLLFLKNKKKLNDSLMQKLTLFKEELALLEAELTTLGNESEEKMFGFSISDSTRLREHIYARKQLDKLGWSNHLSISKEECQETIADYESDVVVAREYTRLNKALGNLSYSETEHKRAALDYEELKNTAEAVFSCPSCSESVCIINGSLELSSSGAIIMTDKKKQLLAEKRRSLAEFETRAAKYSVLAAELAGLAEPDDSLNVLETQLCKWKTYQTNMIKTDEWSRLLISSLSASDAEIALHSVEQQHRKEDRRKSLKDRIVKTSLRISEMEIVAKHIIDYSFEIDSLSKQLSNAELRQKMIEERALFHELSKEKAAYECRARVADQRRLAMSELKDVITRAELKHIENAILSIEMLVNDYCELIFTEPLTIKFILSSEGKTTGILKAQIGLRVFYKGMRFESAAMLSGGEFARLNLCISMALASRFSSRLLLLDEVTSQLNQELVEKMVWLLKERVSCKVLIVAHGVVEGAFEEVVKMKNTIY